ncbi:MAG: class I SAM-dependent methyltransferase [Anaerolineales bacterium]|nr:class I SAM-dependent methyltransferase [Anaerolineales bacterium]
MPKSRADWLAELRPYADEAARMTGWDFAHLPQPLGAPPSWDYELRARELAASAARFADLGTGGGELLVRVLAGYTGRAVATEQWEPNVPVAARRLAALHTPVVNADSYYLPFASGSFNLVLDRHEALRPAEVARVLAPGGVALTQQIHPDWYFELREAFPRMTRWEQHDETYPRGFAAGMELVDFRSHDQLMAYPHLGPLVYMLVAAPWTVPDFSLETDLDTLLEVDRTLRRPEGIVLTDRRYILEARKSE